ncbi:MAG: hypothetical protein AAF480_08360 [Actinomycetota bacterium]
MTSKRTPRLAALGLSTALIAAACGAGDSQQTTAAVPDLDEAELPVQSPATEEEPTSEPTAAEAEPAEATAAPSETAAASEPEDEPAAEPAGENQLPEVEVVDLASGDNVLLSSFAPADRPIVLWFWAPH